MVFWEQDISSCKSTSVQNVCHKRQHKPKTEKRKRQSEEERERERERDWGEGEGKTWKCEKYFEGDFASRADLDSRARPGLGHLGEIQIAFLVLFEHTHTYPPYSHTHTLIYMYIADTHTHTNTRPDVCVEFSLVYRVPLSLHTTLFRCTYIYYIVSLPYTYVTSDFSLSFDRFFHLKVSMYIAACG